MPIPGQGFYAKIDGLHLDVQWRDQNWQYRIFKIQGNDTLTPWTIPKSENEYQEPGGTKFHAVSDALGKLNRPDDPHEVFDTLPWHEYAGKT